MVKRNLASDDVFTREEGGKDWELDVTLRPQRFDGFVGQRGIKESLRIYIQAAQQRK